MPRNVRKDRMTIIEHDEKETKKVMRGKFQRQTSILMWKSFLQRQRRWRLLVIESAFGMLLCLGAIFIARPVFLTPLQAEPDEPLGTKDILNSLQNNTLLGYAPDIHPYSLFMTQAAISLNIPLLHGKTESELNDILYNMSKGTPIEAPIIWVIWEPMHNNKWKFSIRSTERARYLTNANTGDHPNPHLRAGFLAVQVAISKAIVEFVSPVTPDYEVNLVSMPISPLMQQGRVRKALSLILMCFTLAFLPTVLETQALVVWETQNMFKKALRMRNVSYSSMYLSWIVYAYLTAFPVCILGAVTMILIFRWIHLITSLLILFAYLSVMTMVSLVMAMFHNNAQVSCIWTTLFTLLQTYLAELLVHHQYDTLHVALTFVLHVLLPPLGLINAFNEFALLSTGRIPDESTSQGSLVTMLVSWCLLIIFYFGLLMLLQRTIGQQRAIGGQVSWKSIIFKKAVDNTKLNPINPPSRSEYRKIQEVDEFVAKAVSFRDVCKLIMGVPVLHNLTFDIYRGEYSVIFSEKIQETMIDTLEDVLTGLTLPDSGVIRVLGETLTETSMPLNMIYMMGYCLRSETLVDDLTVEEHFNLFSTICLWYADMETVTEYNHVQYKQLIKECNLTTVCHTRVRDLDIYYRAQLCWALAMLLEPRVIVIPNLQDEPTYRAVIIDKIMRYRKHLSIVRFLFSSLEIEYADRMFVFDSKVIVFGGTPAYMFFRYGREYRIRLSLKASSLDESPEYYYKLLSERAQKAGGSVRSHLGSLIILRIPALPSKPFAELITDITDNANKYGVTSGINISVPDSEEVVRRAIQESRTSQYLTTAETTAAMALSKAALKRIAEPKLWRPSTRMCTWHLKEILWKFFKFHVHHKCLLTLTFLFAIVAGLLLGWSLCSVLYYMDATAISSKILKSEVLTVECLNIKTTLVVRTDTSPEAQSIAEAYVMSDTNTTENDIKDMSYIALPHTESLKEHLVTRAIDSPQKYVYIYAYGMDVTKANNGRLSILALYSPLNFDHGAAARSLARVYMALVRHYTEQLDATIQVKDDPLALDLSPWMRDLAQPPLFLQFLLILNISHITLLPSLEYGLIRHIQKHAMDFSPLLYWGTLYVCDLLFFMLLVLLMGAMILVIVYVTAPNTLSEAYDVLVLPCMLFLYGVGCVPQAYIFSLGPSVTLNIMTFVIVNMVFGETTIVAKLFYGNALDYALGFMNISPQFNMAYAYVKIKQIFLYNNECIKLNTLNVCESNQFHKCCEKCGVLQECFSRKNYFSVTPGIFVEVMAMAGTTVLFSIILLLIEYKMFIIFWKYVSKKLYYTDIVQEQLSPGVEREMNDVLEKKQAIRSRRRISNSVKVDTFGEYLCAENVTRRVTGLYIVRNVYFGIGRGEALAISGLKRHGRMDLLEILSGYRIPCEGNVWAMSKFNLSSCPHKYSRQVSVSCEMPSLPPWLTLRTSLEFIASLRGVPPKYLKQEARNLIEALELSSLANTRISQISLNDLTRVHFAAAVIGAPPVIIVDEVTAWQRFSVRRAIYNILYTLRKKGHAILTASTNIESHLPVTSRRLGFMIDGTIYDIDSVEKLVHSYSPEGFTVVVHLKDEVDVLVMFKKYFHKCSINDSSEVLVNVQIKDANLSWKTIVERMETLLSEHDQVYSYIVTATAIDYVYNALLSQEQALKQATGFISWNLAKKIISSKPKTKPPEQDLRELKQFESIYDLTTLKQLPWSVIFQSNTDNDH